ncbi:MAG: SprT family zinc-dependent metalloprotease [Anaerovorax sp.]
MIEYQLIRSKRKTLSMSITKNLQVLVRAPLSVKKAQIDAFVNSHGDWIEKHKALMHKRQQARPDNNLSEEDIIKLKREAKKVIPERVGYYSQIMDVVPTGVKITSAATRWGSCSGTNRLCFSYRLLLYPREAMDYIVVHELAHIRVKDHSKRFYEEVEKYMPDYRERANLLNMKF